MEGFILLGDCHFGCRNSNKHLNLFFERFYNETFFPYLIENKISKVIQVGDIFDSRKFTNHVSAHDANNYFFSKFDEYDIELFTLLGNHDITFKQSLSVNAPELFLSGFNNIQVITKSTSIQLDDHNAISLIPWICEENYDECIEYIKNDRNILCAGHFEIESFKMYQSGISCEHGLSVKLFSNYEYVFSGHYHHRSTKSNITYVGTPYEMTWQDYGDKKGFHFFDTNSRKLNFVENPNSIFVKVEYDDSGASDATNSSYLSDEYHEQFNAAYVKVQVVNKSNPYLFDLFIDKLNSVNPIDVTIDEVIVDTLVDEEVDESDDTLTIVNKYIDSVEYNDLDKNKLKHIMSNLYSEANSITV